MNDKGGIRAVSSPITLALEQVEIAVGQYRFKARMEASLAPRTCAFFRSLLPLTTSVVHCRWSGESLWVPLTPPVAMMDFENHTSYPQPGQLLLYSHPYSEPEILMPYGACSFRSKVGQLAGNHFLTIEEPLPDLTILGHDVLWSGASPITFRSMTAEE